MFPNKEDILNAVNAYGAACIDYAEGREPTATLIERRQRAWAEISMMLETVFEALADNTT